MKKSTLLLAAALFAALFAFKTFYPSAANALSGRAGEIFKNDIDYRAVLSELGDTFAVFGDDEPEEYTPAASEKYIILSPVEPASPAALVSEAAVNTGEQSALQAPELPAAVTAFLESQKEYAHYEIPENVSYDYTPYPGENTVPVAGYSSSGFGYRVHPVKGEVRFHYGTDFAAWTGEEILSFADGVVTFAGYCDSYGNYITLDHGGGWESLYAHCSELRVQSGDSVEAGSCIALVGATGLVTGPHLHFELTKDGVYVNPEYYVN